MIAGLWRGGARAVLDGDIILVFSVFRAGLECYVTLESVMR